MYQNYQTNGLYQTVGERIMGLSEWVSEWVSEQFLNSTSAQYRLCTMQCHSIKITQKLSIYNWFKNNISSEIN